MDCKITNEEFHNAFSNTPWHYAPDGYWDRINKQRKEHKFVGRKAIVYGKVHECVRAEDNLVIFKLREGSEAIISGNDVENIKWIKE